MGHFVSSPRTREKRDSRDSTGDERGGGGWGQGRKRNRTESKNINNANNAVITTTTTTDVTITTTTTISSTTTTSTSNNNNNRNTIQSFLFSKMNFNVVSTATRHQKDVVTTLCLFG